MLTPIWHRSIRLAFLILLGLATPAWSAADSPACGESELAERRANCTPSNDELFDVIAAELSETVVRPAESTATPTATAMPLVRRLPAIDTDIPTEDTDVDFAGGVISSAGSATSERASFEPEPLRMPAASIDFRIAQKNDPPGRPTPKLPDDSNVRFEGDLDLEFPSTRGGGNSDDHRDSQALPPPPRDGRIAPGNLPAPEDSDGDDSTRRSNDQVMTISALIGDQEEGPDPREQAFCERMWACAGGRYQSPTHRMMCKLARNYQVMWAGRCGLCSGFGCGPHFTPGVRPLCGPAFGSYCGVGLWREGVTDLAGYRTGCHGACNGSCTADLCTGGCPSGGGGGGEPWTVWGHLWEGYEPRNKIGGWTSAGYHSRENDLFNDHPHRFNANQMWLYWQRSPEITARRSMDFGYRVDVLYGVDAQDTQAYGNRAGTWDFMNGFDHGSYGWAIPQAYGELAAGNFSLMFGHFYTIMGYEVVPAPDNFFYSHAMTMFNSEPFTHTGILSTWSGSDSLELYAGWTLGWNTGFDQFSGGNSFLGGFKFRLLDALSATYTTSFGDFGRRGSSGYAHSIVFTSNLSDRLAYVVQSDLLRVGREDNVGVNQYLLYELSAHMSLGSRLEWWKGDRITNYTPYGSALPAAGSFSYYGATFGANFKVGRNLVIRPESRLEWSPALGYSQGIGAVDMVLTY